MTISVLTIFPKIFTEFLTAGILKRAQEEERLAVRLVNIRDFATDKHRTTDDTPYGGGPGMVMKIEPIFQALKSLLPDPTQRTNHCVILLAARGQPFTQQKAQELLSLSKDIVLICGRYEGVDQRVADHLCDEELSIGPYVLSGGEVPAMVVIEAVSRLLPGVLGNPESLKEESYRSSDSLLGHAAEYPQYTKPEVFQGWDVPAVLLSGNHKRIADWRTQHTHRLP